jgi:hypothetical protein
VEALREARGFQVSTMTETDWQERAIALKAEGLESKEIAEAVGKHPATVRKVIARANVEEVEAIKADFERVIEEEAHEPVFLPPFDGNGHVPGQTDLSDFIAEAGEAVGPMPPREMDAGEIDYVEEQRVDGTQQYAFDFGGSLPSDATITFTGTFPSGFFQKGDMISGRFTARVTGVAGKDKLDKKSGVFCPAPQAHAALITVLEVD